MPEPIDVFLTTKADRPIRIFMAQATIAWWLQEQEKGRVRLTIFDVGSKASMWDPLHKLYGHAKFPIMKSAPIDSNRNRHRWAAKLAESDVYICTDDDLLPSRNTCLRMDGFPTRWNEYILDAMERHPKWGLMCALVVPGGVDPYVTAAALRRDGVEISEEDANRIEVALALPVAADGERWPVGNCGGVRVMRKGAIDPDGELPALEAVHGGGYDATLCNHVRDRGYEIGRLVRWRAIHLGDQETEVWRGAGRDPEC